MNDPWSCLRCHGEGQTEIDRAPPIPPELCHRCEGTGVEPPPTPWTADLLDYFLAKLRGENPPLAEFEAIVREGMLEASPPGS